LTGKHVIAFDLGLNGTFAVMNGSAACSNAYDSFR